MPGICNLWFFSVFPLFLCSAPEYVICAGEGTPCIHSENDYIRGIRLYSLSAKCSTQKWCDGDGIVQKLLRFSFVFRLEINLPVIFHSLLFAFSLAPSNEVWRSLYKMQNVNKCPRRSSRRIVQSAVCKWKGMEWLATATTAAISLSRSVIMHRSQCIRSVCRDVEDLTQ